MITLNVKFVLKIFAQKSSLLNKSKIKVLFKDRLEDGNNNGWKKNIPMSTVSQKFFTEGYFNPTHEIGS